MPAPWAKYLQGVFLLGKGVLNMNKLLPIRWLSVLILGVFLLLSGKSWAAEFEPVSYTAYTSLFWLREAGVPEAAEYAKATGKQHLLFTGKIKNFYTLQPVNMVVFLPVDFIWHGMGFGLSGRSSRLWQSMATII